MHIGLEEKRGKSPNSGKEKYLLLLVKESIEVNE
jgi:hypothetical protein